MMHRRDIGKSFAMKSQVNQLKYYEDQPTFGQNIQKEKCYPEGG